MTEEQRALWMGFIREDKTYENIMMNLSYCWAQVCVSVSFAA